MIANNLCTSTGSDSTVDETLFARIAQDIEKQGYSIRPSALPEQLANALWLHQQSMDPAQFNRAGIGRGDQYLKSDFIRSNTICWIDGKSAAGRQWLNWSGALQQYLNHRLFLGLFSFESHFAHYQPGDFYKRHVDAFKGSANRVLSVVVYLNPGWTGEDGGELVLYMNSQDREGTRVTPLMGTLVTFLSEDFPHEVLPASRDRYSIAGWFRVNTSGPDRVDPPA